MSAHTKAFAAALVFVIAVPVLVSAREREPNSVFAERRTRLATQLGAPVVLFGFTGKENASPSYVFNQEENFYYLTGHNEEGAALLLVPPAVALKGWKGPAEILFLPPRDLAEERWNGVRMGPDDPGIAGRTGFAAVETFAKLRDRLSDLAKISPEIY
ncbi:MAG TPA: aminopeptidase P N-terminal domain-containing protein, partial [Candidatus Acidoferrales bacterium]